MDLKEFFEIIETRTEEGISLLKKTKIGTEEYTLLVNQIISNTNLLLDKDVLVNGKKQQEPEKDIKRFIGEDFYAWLN